MQKTVTAIAGSVIGVVVLGGWGFASHVQPAKAKSISFPLVNSYSPCDPGFANTATQTGGMPACSPPSPNGVTLCAFTSTGSGKMSLKIVGSASAGTQDLGISVAAKGLNEFCNLLDVHFRYRLTTDDCPPGSCTAADGEVFLAGASCNVTDGKCKIKTTLNTAAPGFMATNGKNAGIEILGCGLTAPNLAQPISCGLLLK